MPTPPGVSSLELVEAILSNPETYRLAEAIPNPDPSRGGRPRQYPAFMWIVFEALISVYGSARQADAELGHPVVWALVRRLVKEQFPAEPSMHIPSRPMRRHHYRYGRDRYLSDPAVYARIAELHRVCAAEQATEMGLLDPDGPGSWTHPHPSRLVHADGKVVAPLFRAKPDEVRVDRRTGEIVVRRHEPDAGLHFEGTGEAAWGTKFVIVAARTEDVGGRVILDVESVEVPGAEAAVAMTCFRRLAPLLPGAQAIVYDTALRGVHHQEILRDLGLLPINRVTSAVAAIKKPRRKGGRRVPKSVHLEAKQVRMKDGTTPTVQIYALDGAVGIGRLTETGDLDFEPLPRFRTHRNRDGNGRYRWYNDYRLPEDLGGGVLTVRLHGTEADAARKLNRTENVRPIPPSDPDFEGLFRRRNDAESINRHLDDTMWLGRAHSVGRKRQLVNLLGFALMVNSLALHRHRRRLDEPLAA